MDEHKLLHQPVGKPVGIPVGKPVGGGGNFLGPLFGIFSTKSLRYSTFLLKSLRYPTILGATFQFPPKSLPYSTILTKSLPYSAFFRANPRKLPKSLPYSDIFTKSLPYTAFSRQNSRLGTWPERFRHCAFGHLTRPLPSWALDQNASPTLASFPLSHDLQKIFFGGQNKLAVFFPQRGRIGAFFSIFRDLQD